MENTYSTNERVQRRTVSSLLGKKVLDFVEKSTLSQTLKTASLICLSTGITIVLVDPTLLIKAGQYSFSFCNYLVPKFIVTTTIVFRSTTALKAMKRLYLIKPKQRLQLIEGVPTTEILDHIFTEGSFKREEIKKKFGISHDRSNKLAQKLEDLGVFVRRENNARVLNPEMSRQDVAALLEGKTSADELVPVMKREANNAWTTDPLGPKIQARVEEALSSPPIFTFKRLSA